jgi:hypothetical protein
LGNIYLGLNKDVLFDNDLYGLWKRKINYNRNPLEHWHRNADDASWTGWAAYTGFSTPNGNTYSPQSFYLVRSTSGAAKWFRYRPFINAQASVFSRLWPSYYLGTGVGGVMVDDGVNNADGNGANNFVRVFVENASATVNPTVKIQSRVGGGAVSTYSYMSVPYGQPVGVGLVYGIGTRWSSWQTNFYLSTEYGTDELASISGLTWTPARIGFYGYTSASYGGTKYDWYDES